MIKKKQDLENELYIIKLNQKGMTLDKEKKPIKLNEKIDKKMLEEREKDVNEQLKEYQKRYDTYSDDLTCYYRKVARENNFELVGWYELNDEKIFSDNIEFKDLKRRDDYTETPKILLLSWDIESSDTRGPGYFPLGKNPESYVYMIQVDLY